MYFNFFLDLTEQRRLTNEGEKTNPKFMFE